MSKRIVIDTPTTTEPGKAALEQKKPSNNPPAATKLNGSLPIGLQIASLEALFVLMEFIFGSTILTSMIRFALNPVLSHLFQSATCTLVYSILGNLAVTAWIIARFSWSIKSTFRETLHLLITSLKPHGGSLSSLLWAFFGAHALSFLAMLAYQYYSGTWVYSLDNFYLPSSSPSSPLPESSSDQLGLGDGMDTASQIAQSSFSLLKLLQLTCLSPFTEELIFRGVMLSYVHLRIAKYYPSIWNNAHLHITPKQPKQKAKKDQDGRILDQDQEGKAGQQQNDGGADHQLDKSTTHTARQAWTIPQLSSLLCAILFGLIHIINLSGDYDRSYVCFQVLLGALIGLFLNTVMYTHGLGAALLVHIVNNSIASLFPATHGFFSKDNAAVSPLLVFGIVETTLMFCLFAWFSWKSIGIPANANTNAQGNHPSTPLLPTCPSFKQDALTKQHTRESSLFHIFENDVLNIASQRMHIPAFTSAGVPQVQSKAIKQA